AAGTAAITVSSAVVSATGKTVTLTLSRAVANTETVTVSYTKPESGAVVQDAAGNDAANFSDRAVTNNTPTTPAPADTTPPVFSSAVVNGDQLVLTYIEANSLDAAALTGNAGFTVSSRTGTAITVSGAVVSGAAKTITLTLSRAVTSVEVVRVSYTKPATGAVVQDAAGNHAANFDGMIATHGTPAPADTTPPEFSRAVVTGDQLVLTYTEAGTLDAAALAGNAGFTVNNAAGTTAITVSSAVVNATAKTVTLTLSRAVAATETVTVSYTKPESGAVVQDAAGNDAVSFSDQAVTNNSPPADTTPPVFSSAAVNGNQLVISYTEANTLDAAALAGNAGFAVNTAAGTTAITVSSAVVNGAAKTITLTLSRAVTSSETVRVSYTKPESGAVVQDAAGNDAVSFSDRAVTNNTPAPADTTPPVFSSAAVNGDQLVISYTDANSLDAAALAGNAGFAVSSTTGTVITVSGAVVHATNKTVTLTLSRAVTRAETVKVSYTKPASGAVVQDAAGNDAVSFSEQAVTNNSPLANTTATITLADTALTAGETTTVTFSFSEPVTGFDASDVVLTDANGTLGALTANADGKTWTATFTPANNVEDSSNTISVNLAGVTNAAGRAGTGSAASTSYSMDTKRPTVVSLTFAKSKLSAGESTTATITFSEKLNRDSFTLNKLSSAPGTGTLSNLHTTDDGITWTFTLTAPASGTSGPGILGIQLSNVTDLAGNTGVTRYLNQSPYVLDFGPPTATITLADTALTAGETTTVTFTFSESVTGFDASDVVLTDANGTLGALTLTPDTDNKIWTATFTPTANVNAQANTIRVNLSGVSNNADRAGTSTVASATYTVDTRTDTTPPVIDTATVNGNQLVLTYAEVNTLNAAALTGNAGYAVSSSTNTAITVSSAVVNAAAKTVTLTLSRAVTQTETVKVSYTKPASGAGVQDAAGNDAANFSDRTVTNNTDNTAPQLITTSNVATGNEHQLPTVSGGGSNLVLTFRDTSNLNEDAARKPAAGDFTVSVDGASRTVNSVTVNTTGKIILLALATPVAAGQHVTVAYQDSTPDDGKGIQDTANNRLASFPTTEAVNNVLDMDAPQLITTGTTRPTANGNQLVLSFSDVNNLSADPARKPTVGDFTVLVAGAANAVTAVAVNGAAKTITLTLSTAVTPGQTATVAYTDSTPNDTSAIQDAKGNRLTGFAATEVNTPDTTPPEFSSATVRGNQLVISYAEAGTLDATALAGNAGFTVSTTGTAITVSSAVVNATDKTVTLTLSRAVTQAETVKVSYTKPESGAVVQDAAGNDAANLSDRAVTNNTPSGTADTTAPVLLTTGIHRPELLGGTMLTIRFSDTSNLDVDPSHAPAIGDFTVRVNGALRTVSGVAVDGPGKYILLELANPP
ncbi:hypothetical protein D8B21_20820, partial [Verminephrobacter aporrectodeae subsp. tuberculatae]|uniref:beta strand repeat-containing protein n=3 Tax=Verminephrobacter aporrectodeae TaxID=1110389 RepID=UPI002243F596